MARQIPPILLIAHSVTDNIPVYASALVRAVERGETSFRAAMASYASPAMAMLSEDQAEQRFWFAAGMGCARAAAVTSVWAQQTQGTNNAAGHMMMRDRAIDFASAASVRLHRMGHSHLADRVVRQVRMALSDTPAGQRFRTAMLARAGKMPRAAKTILAR